MWDKAGIFRTESLLQSAIQDLNLLENELDHQYLALKTRHYNQELVEALENHFLVTTARCIAETALLRNESRGAHYRHDYAETDNPNWLKHHVIRQVDEKLKIETAPVDLREIQPRVRRQAARRRIRSSAGRAQQGGRAVASGGCRRSGILAAPAPAGPSISGCVAVVGECAPSLPAAGLPPAPPIRRTIRCASPRVSRS